MACNIVHSVIERKKKNRDIYVPAQYVQLIEDAKTKSPPYSPLHWPCIFLKISAQSKSTLLSGRVAKLETQQLLTCDVLKYLPSGEIHRQLRHTDDWNQQLPSWKVHTTSNQLLSISWSHFIIHHWKSSQTSSRISSFLNRSFSRTIMLFMII